MPLYETILWSIWFIKLYDSDDSDDSDDSELVGYSILSTFEIAFEIFVIK